MAKARLLASFCLLSVVLIASSAAAQPPQTLAAADEAMRDGRFAEAARQYEAWLERHPDTPGVLFALGVCRIQLGRAREAVDVLRTHIALAPRSADGHAALGVALIDAAASDDARRALETALGLDRTQLQALEALARLHLVERRPADAVALLERVSDMDVPAERRLELRMLRAEAMITAGRPSEAARVLEPDLSRADAPAAAFALACLGAIRAGELERAAQICEQGMRRHPDSEIEGVYLSLPPAVLAARTAARLSALGPRPEPAELIALGRVLTDVDPTRQTRAEQLARQLLTDAVAAAPDSASAHYNLGRVLRRTDLPGALTAWRTALALAPAPALRLQIETQIARALDAQSDAVAADAMFRRALATNRQLARRVPETALDYVRFLRQQTRHREAEELLNEVVGWNPWAPEARLERARLLADQGQWPAVIAEAQFVLAHSAERKPLLRVAHLLMSRAYHRMGQPERARVHREWLESQ